MSIDEMITTIDSWVIQIEERIQPFARKELFEKEKQIIAALKAGQAMRDCLGRDGSADDTLDDIYIANDIELAFEVEAWDVATKGGV